MDDRRTLMTKLATVLVAGAVVPASAPLAAQERTGAGPGERNVRAFGAVGDGRTDDTAAFNAATGATGRAGAATIHVPPGHYRIDGTVFIRKGQSLVGSGDASLIDASNARGPTLVLGHDSRNQADPGGDPATVAQMRFLGGSGSAPLISAGIEGFALRDLFISAAGTAIEIGGADGIVSNIIVDQALNGIVLRGARNVVVKGLVGYLVRYGITIDRGTNDIVMSDLILAYSQHASILFADGAAGITSIRVANGTFVSSIQYSTFIGHVHARARDFDAHFVDCTFRNWREFAVVQGAQSGADLTFSNCVFDGARSHPSYNASATAKGVQAGANGRFRFNGCQFRNLAGEIAFIGPSLRELTIDGGLIDRCAGDPLRFGATAAGRIRIRNVDGFGRRIDGAGASALVLPWWGNSIGWRIGAARRGAPGGIATATVAVVADGRNVACSIGEAGRYGALSPIAAGLGDGPGGPTQGSFGAGNGRLCVSVASGDVDWSAETIV